MVCAKCAADLGAKGAAVCFVCHSDPQFMKDRDYLCEACWDVKHRKCEALIPRWVSRSADPEPPKPRRTRKKKADA